MVSLDGTKIKASLQATGGPELEIRRNELEVELEAEVAELLRQAEEADSSEAPDGLDLPAELARREERLAAIARAKAEIERRAAERHARSRPTTNNLLERKASEETGRSLAAKSLPPEPGPRDKDQVNLTDDERLIKYHVPGGGFDQCYNAQASVDVDSS